jgi:hypothetical protein
MKIETFCNGNLDAAHIGFRIRGVANSKTIRVPVELLGDTIPAKNDGVVLEINGDVKSTERYISVTNCKVVSIKPGAYQPAAKTMSAEDALSACFEQAGLPAEPPFEV